MSATNCSKPKRTTSINYSKPKRTGPAVLRSSSTPAILAWRKHLSGFLPFFGYIATSSCCSLHTLTSHPAQVCEQQQRQVRAEVPAGDLGQDRQDHQELPQLCHGSSRGRADDRLN